MKNNFKDANYYVAGDVYHTKATVYGGDDVINGARKNIGDGSVYGDAYRVSGAGAGTGGRDTINGTDKRDYIAGDFATVSGAVRAFAGNDTIHGKGGHDRIIGDIDQDPGGVVKKWGKDKIFGGDGRDQIIGEGLGVSAAPGGHDRLFGNNGFDIIYGQYGNDYVSGGKGPTSRCGPGNDIVKGGRGDDKLLNTKGKDVFTGHRGADQFIFHSMDGDKITDFNKGPRNNRDKIDLRNIPEITDYDDLVASHLIDPPGKGSFVITLGGDRYVTVKGTDYDDITPDMFIF